MENIYYNQELQSSSQVSNSLYLTIKECFKRSSHVNLYLGFFFKIFNTKSLYYFDMSNLFGNIIYYFIYIIIILITIFINYYSFVI